MQSKLESSPDDPTPQRGNDNQLIALEQVRTTNTLAHWKGILAASINGSILYHLSKSGNESTGGWGLASQPGKISGSANFEDGRMSAFVVGTYAFESAIQMYTRNDQYMWTNDWLQVPTASLVRSPKSNSLRWSNALATAVYAEMRRIVADDYVRLSASSLLCE